MKPVEKTGVDYLSPKLLLLGISSEHIVAGPFKSKHVTIDNPKAVITRHILVQAITN